MSMQSTHEFAVGVGALWEDIFIEERHIRVIEDGVVRPNVDEETWERGDDAGSKQRW